jgi:hypothetical protein
MKNMVYRSVHEIAQRCWAVFFYFKSFADSQLARHPQLLRSFIEAGSENGRNDPGQVIALAEDVLRVASASVCDACGPER